MLIQLSRVRRRTHWEPWADGSGLSAFPGLAFTARVPRSPIASAGCPADPIMAGCGLRRDRNHRRRTHRRRRAPRRWASGGDGEFWSPQPAARPKVPGAHTSALPTCRWAGCCRRTTSRPSWCQCCPAACTTPRSDSPTPSSIPPPSCSRRWRRPDSPTCVVGIEGPAWTIVDAPGDDADARFDSALRCAQLTENFAEIVDASAHLMALATAP